MNLLKRLFCEHEYEFVRNIYGDEINACGGYRSIWKCKKCGKIEYRKNCKQFPCYSVLIIYMMNIIIINMKNGEH